MRLIKTALATACWLALLAPQLVRAAAPKSSAASTKSAAAPSASASAQTAEPSAPTPQPTAQEAPAAPPQPAVQATGTAQVGDSSSSSMSASASSDSSVGFFDNYSIRLGAEAAGPLHFRDTPDGRVEQTSVFEIGPRVAFLFGHELKDIHRAGLGFAYLSVAKSDSRHLNFIPIFFMYEIGHPLVLQATVGANIASGSSGFTKEYGGVHTGMVLRYSFQSAAKWSPITVSPGIAARANISAESMQYSSVFLGAQLEISYNSNN